MGGDVNSVEARVRLCAVQGWLACAACGLARCECGATATDGVQPPLTMTHTRHFLPLIVFSRIFPID